MWFYLFGKNGKYPDPLFEIKALAELSNSGMEVYLKPEPGLVPQPARSQLARLTEVMDEAWEAGRLTPETIKTAIERFRKAHPYSCA
jgi:hypothetical protein